MYCKTEMKTPEIKKEKIKALSETKFLNTYDIEYEMPKTGRTNHYFIATRRSLDNLTALKSDEQRDSMLPDAVTCYIVIHSKDKEDRLLLQYEYRFPIGGYLLCPVAGIIDKADLEKSDALIVASKREIYEETGLMVKDGDKLEVISDLVFSTPGFTDECNALVAAYIYLDNPEAEMNHNAAEDTELFGDFALLTKEECKALLKSGRDPRGHFYPLYAYAAMSWFVADVK